MINKVLFVLFVFICVFFQVYFFDMFDAKINFVLIPFLYFYFRESWENIHVYSFCVFIFYEFLSNFDTLGIFLIIYLIFNDLIKLLVKNYGFNFSNQARILAFIGLYHSMSKTLLSTSFWLSLGLFILTILTIYYKKNEYKGFN